jgi:hypothetical protein
MVALKAIIDQKRAAEVCGNASNKKRTRDLTAAGGGGVKKSRLEKDVWSHTDTLLRLKQEVAAMVH